MKKPNILVTSASGKTGQAITLQLLERGYPVRAFVRRKDARSDRLTSAGAELFVGDQYAIADMRNAMKGMQRVSHCAPTAPNGLHFGAALAIAAFEERIEHIVTIGQWLANPHHPSQSTRESWLNDQLIRMMPDTTLTVNNPGWFADNYFMVLGSAAQLGMLPMPLGDGDALNNAPPSNEDIAAVSVGALCDPATHAGKIYRPTGPELLSMNQITATIGNVLGRKVKYMPLSERMFLKAMRSQNMPNMFLTEMVRYADEYRRGTFAVGGTTDAVHQVGGREPEDFTSITRRYVEKMPETKRSLDNWRREMLGFMKILLTRTPDLDRLKDQRDYVRLATSAFSNDDPDWRTTHDPSAGYRPDVPNTSS